MGIGVSPRAAVEAVKKLRKMKTFRKQCGFSTLEVLTAVAVIAILATILVGVGKRLRAQANEKLAQSTIDIIVAALEQYYDFHGDFPFIAGVDYGLDPCDLQSDVGTVTNGVNKNEYASSEALYYFLSTTPKSRRIIDTITDKLITNKGANGTVLKIEIPSGSGNKTDLIRFIDPWGKSLRYTYQAGDNFPVIKSAGPDGDITTAADNITSR